MFGDFWQKMVESIAGEWSARSLMPALAFWFGGAALWLLTGNDPRPPEAFAAHATLVQLVLALVAALLLLVVTTSAVQVLTLPTLKLLEGYRWPGDLRRLLADRRWQRRGRLRERLLQLEKKRSESSLSGQEEEEAARCDRELLLYCPSREALVMPTRIGNLLKAAEEYPQRLYGIEMSDAWPLLWLLLPETARNDIGQARAALDEQVACFVWSILFAAWSLVSLWAIPIAAACATAFYLNATTQAGNYGDMLRSVFTLYRFDLYSALHCCPPDDPQNEVAYGQLLARYIRRGETQGLRWALGGERSHATPEPSEGPPTHSPAPG